MITSVPGVQQSTCQAARLLLSCNAGCAGSGGTQSTSPVVITPVSGTVSTSPVGRTPALSLTDWHLWSPYHVTLVVALSAAPSLPALSTTSTPSDHLYIRYQCHLPLAKLLCLALRQRPLPPLANLLASDPCTYVPSQDHLSLWPIGCNLVDLGHWCQCQADLCLLPCHNRCAAGEADVDRLKSTSAFGSLAPSRWVRSKAAQWPESS